MNDENRSPVKLFNLFFRETHDAQIWCRPKEMEEMDMQEEPGHAEGREDPVPTQTVLIVEDDADIRDALVAILQDATSY